MRPAILWHPDWTESRVVAVDENAFLSMREGKRPPGYVAAVSIPVPPGTIEAKGGKLLFAPRYLPEDIPEIELFSEIDPDLDRDRYVRSRPPRELKESVEALLHLAAKIANVSIDKARDIDRPDGWRESAKVAWKGTKTDIRRRWLTAWLWPRLNRFPGETEAGERFHRPLSMKDRADVLNEYMAALGWSCPLTPATLKTEAARLGLFFPQ